MNQIQTNASDEALVTAIRANMCDFFRHLSRSNAAEHYEDEQFTRWYAPLPHPWFNGVLSSNKHEENFDAFIGEAIQYFRTKGVGVFTWWMEPHLQPADWEPALSKFGFRFSDDTPGMAVDLHELRQSPPTARGFELRLVEDKESLQTWARVFLNGFDMPSAWEPLIVNLWMQLGLNLPMRNYLGFLYGNPVSTSSLFYGGGAAGIYCVATLREARGQGLGAALTLQPLLEAREWGYRIGVLQSSKMGFNIYKRLGFRHLCQIEYFYLSLL